MNKEICFISSPGNGLSCCCCQSEVRSPSPTLPGKWNEAADPNLNPMQAVETESIGNSRVGSTSTRRSAKGGKKKKAKKYEATVMPVPLDYLCPFVFRLDLILPAISQPILQRLQRVRCALRALMMPISLSILLPFHLGRVIEIHGDIFVSNAYAYS